MALAILALAAVGVGTASAGRVTRTLNEQYHAFVHLTEPQGSSVPSSSSRLVSGVGNRYDYWRVAWSAWREHPLRGVGAGNYDEPYFRERTTTEDVRQPHSVELQALSELGLVGALLLGLMLTGVVLGSLRLARAARTAPASRALLVAAGGMVAAVVAHTSVDWIHLLPGVAGIALLAAAVLVREPEEAPRANRARPTAARRAGLALAAMAIVLVAVSLSRQTLADHFQASAEAALTREPAVALREADRALRLDPESIGSYYVKAAAFARFDEAGPARAALREAARREPGDFVTWALLGDLAVRSGDRREAKRLYSHALGLNPLDPALQQLAREGQPVR